MIGYGVFGCRFDCLVVLFKWLHSLFTAVPKYITEVFGQISAKWLCRAAVRWCGNGCLRYKSLVFRFDLRCFQIQTTRFPTKIQGFTHSIHHFPNTITYVSDTDFLFSDTVQSFRNNISRLSNHIPTLPDTIPSFSNPNSTTSTHHYTVFMMRLPPFSIRISCFTYSDTKFYAFNPPLSNQISPLFTYHFGKSTHKSTVPQLGYAAFKPRLLDFTCFSGGCKAYLQLFSVR